MHFFNTIICFFNSLGTSYKYVFTISTELLVNNNDYWTQSYLVDIISINFVLDTSVSAIIDIIE